MKQSLKYIAIILVCGIVLVIISQVKSFFDKPTPFEGTSQSFTVKPQDERFTETEYREHTVSSNPFSDKTLKGKLPRGITENDVEQTVDVIYKFGDEFDTLEFIETKDGQVFIKKDSAIKFVSVTKFEPPVFSFCMKYGIGVTAGLRNGLHLSPSASLALAEWNIARLNFHAPIITADLDGIGAGAQMQLYHDFSFGTIYTWGWSGERELKASLNFMF
ncbi:MAG: hypothetical protein EPO24_09345 [Bacteroidetes bacterium]|nr:MAG: hypothetical protein EPO24_09345 [Bacteroidota bacterium]